MKKHFLEPAKMSCCLPPTAPFSALTDTEDEEHMAVVVSLDNFRTAIRKRPLHRLWYSRTSFSTNACILEGVLCMLTVPNSRLTVWELACFNGLIGERLTARIPLDLAKTFNLQFFHELL